MPQQNLKTKSVYSLHIDIGKYDIVCSNGTQYVVFPDNIISFLDGVKEKYIDFDIMYGYSRPMIGYVDKKTNYAYMDDILKYMFMNDLKIHFLDESEYLKFKMMI